MLINYSGKLSQSRIANWQYHQSARRVKKRSHAWFSFN